MGGRPKWDHWLKRDDWSVCEACNLVMNRSQFAGNRSKPPFLVYLTEKPIQIAPSDCAKGSGA